MYVITHICNNNDAKIWICFECAKSGRKKYVILIFIWHGKGTESEFRASKREFCINKRHGIADKSWKKRTLIYMVKIVNLHSHSALPSDCVGLLNQRYPDRFLPEVGQFYSVGIHPWDAGNANDELFNLLEKHLANSQVKAIGECGLDRSGNVPLDLQRSVFSRHITLAEKYRMPLIIHAVRTYADLLEMKKVSTVPWILHGYNGTPETTVQLLKSGFYFSFGAALLKNSEKLNNSLKQIPLNRLFFETDEARIHVSEIYDYAASCFGIKIVELQSAICDNFTDIFDI